MPYRLTHTDCVPRGGWKYFQPETRIWITGDDFYSLRDRVKAHRKWKGIPDETADQDIIKQVCMRTGPGGCREYEEYYPDKTDQMTQENMFAFNRALMAFLKEKGQTVSEQEAQRRAEICRSCPFNKPAVNCSCSTFYKAMSALLPSKMKLEGLEVCSVCGCSLKAKTWMPESVVSASSDGTAFPKWCWQREMVG